MQQQAHYARTPQMMGGQPGQQVMIRRVPYPQGTGSSFIFSNISVLRLSLCDTLLYVLRGTPQKPLNLAICVRGRDATILFIFGDHSTSKSADLITLSGQRKRSFYEHFAIFSSWRTGWPPGYIEIVIYIGLEDWTPIFNPHIACFFKTQFSQVPL